MSSNMKTVFSKEVLTVSRQFKKEAIKAIAAIIGFIVVYLLMFAFSLGMVGLSFYGGFSIITARISFYTLLIGAGVIAFGVMIFVFLVKFLFATSKQDETDSIEIKYNDQPNLFDIIHALAKETGTSKPKKIFLSPDVNACVFYNSSFWSMFLPIHKNLKIGLGLVNSVNTSELKAVIAHEFGHFSQSSMKLGSWVYQVNKVIHDMLYNNHDYADAINGIASLHGVLAFFAQITVKVVQGIQWILRQMFKVVNKAYMGLSRQMEFHADLVAASVCGGNNIINSLKRLEFATVCYHTTLDLCNAAWEEKKIAENFYTDYSMVMKRVAELNHLSFENGLPVLNPSGNAISNRINYKDQWASHPTLTEREEHLKPYALAAEVDTQSAWVLFIDQEKWKGLLTKHLYKNIPQQEVKGVLAADEFEAMLEKQFKQFSFPEIFGTYYDNRQIGIFDPNELAQEAFIIKPFKELFTEECSQLPKKITALNQDINLLKAIIKRELDIRSFDFDGRKYAVKEATAVLVQLEADLESNQKELIALDKILFRYFYAIASLPEAELLKQMYINYFRERADADNYLDKTTAIMEAMAPLYKGPSLTIEMVRTIVNDLRGVHDPVFKKLLQRWLDKNILEEQSVLKSRAEKFMGSHYEYFSGTSFFDNELNELNGIANEMWTAIIHSLSLQFKGITEVQAKFVNSKEKEFA